MKKILAALTIPGLLLGGAAVAGAQTDDDGSTTDDTTINSEGRHREGPHREGRRHGPQRLAEALDMTGEELREALSSGETIAEVAQAQGVDIDAVIVDLVAEAQTKADENPDSPKAQNFDAEAMTERLTNAVNSTFEPGDHQRPDRGDRGRPGFGGQVIADALGLDPGDIRAAVQSGSTIADLAGEQGVDIDDVVDQIVADAQARVDEHPDSPLSEKFDADRLEERLTKMVNGEFERGEHRRPGAGPNGRRGPHDAQKATGVDA